MIASAAMSLRRSTRTLSHQIVAVVQAADVALKLAASKKRIVEEPLDLVKPRKKIKKQMSKEGQQETHLEHPVAPVTPVKKTIAAKSRKHVPIPNAQKVIPLPERPVQAHVSNATLVTPGGTQAVAYVASEDQSPTKSDRPRPIATTADLLDKAYAHMIQIDPRLKPWIEKYPCTVFSQESLAEQVEPFSRLCSTIMGQQVTGAAANSIRNKFIALFTEGNEGTMAFPTAAQVAKTDTARLKSAGLSQRKAEYIQGLAQKFDSGELTNDMLLKANDDEVMARLIAVRGLGKWSVEMFSCFDLKRTDVFSTGDLGIQAGMARFHGKDIKKLKAKGGGKWKYMSEQDMLEKSAPFAPYRSLFMWYMWKVADVNIDVMEST